MDWITQPDAWIAFATLTVLELVLGIDNIIFLSILADRVPEESRAKVRRLGLIAAMLMRLALLASLSWVVQMKEPVIGDDISVRDIVLILGGLFLIWKSVREIHHRVEGQVDEHAMSKTKRAVGSVILQIMILDLVFSLDSVITAVGMVDHIGIMVAAVVTSVVCMMLFVNTVSRLVDRHPTIKMLALSFLVLIGVALLAEGFDVHFPRGYVYFSMAFAAGVEALNIAMRKKEPPKP